jgi:hypothetical protein
MIGRKARIRLGLLLALVAGIVALGLSLGSSDDDGVAAPTPRLAATACTRVVGAGANLASALSDAAPGAVLCLRSGKYPGGRIPADATDKDSYVTLEPVPGKKPIIKGELAFDGARHLRLQGLTFKQGLAFAPAASNVQLIGNELTGPRGIFFFGDSSQGGHTSSILIRGNYIHDIDYTGSQETYNGYGIKSIGTQHGFLVKGNTIKSVGADYLQTDHANEWTVEGNTFLGPSLARSHPQEHQDLWQVYAGGTNLEFIDNVARNTATDQSLLFQMTYPNDHFSNVVVSNNLFDHDSRGYTCQIYQSSGLVFSHNTVVRSHWGCILRDEPGYPGGSGYRINHNIFAETEEGSDFSTEGSAGDWGAYDYNVSGDGAANGPHSVPHWKPSWVNRIDYRPRGLPFPAGYRRPTPAG